MIRNTVVNTLNYFYPLGNTPAVCLTQDLIPGRDADLLLLGCGDARNILFTCFTDPERKLDVTCCDIEPAVLARNILLYTLFVDDTEGVRLQQIWNVYYHWKLDDESSNLLEGQAEKLLSLSENITTWRSSAYGRAIRFCDRRSIIKIRNFWMGCTSRGSKRTVLQENLARAKTTQREMVKEGYSLAGVRSAAPVGILALEDLLNTTAKWWKEGITISGSGSQLQPHRLNPAFFASTDQRLVLHYGSEPLLGFPLATAYIPLLDSTCLCVGKEGLSSSEYLSACAYQHFRVWAQAFRKSFSGDLIIRFCVADALALALTLRGATSSNKNALTANIPCDSWTYEALVLNEDEYADPKYPLPRQFDVIDTSNLIDHLGSLNLIPVCASLLKHTVCSTLYTENLVQKNSSEKERIDGLFGANIQTIALLVGLSPCETWTNATNSPEDESILDVLSERSGRSEIGGSTQVRSRLRWKRAFSTSQDGRLSPIRIEPSQVARLLVKLYDHMFEHENIALLFASLGTKTFFKHANPYYNRASFVLLLYSMQSIIVTDWSQCLDEMMSQIVSNFSGSPCGANFAQELLLYMHMVGVDTTRLPAIDLDASKEAKMAVFFGSWPDVPSCVCVTLRVPRRKLQVFTSRAATTIGTPTLRVDIEGGGVVERRWSNTFTSVLVAFGRPQLSQHHGFPVLQIEEDESNWWGSSDMFVSAFIPTWTLLQPDETTPIMKCGLLSTPQSSQAFFRDLGLTLDIFSAKLTSTEVVVSKYMPAMMGLPKFTFEESCPPSESRCSLAATLSSDTTVEKLIHRTSYAGQPEDAKLCDRSTTVQVSFQDVWRASIMIGSEPVSRVSFPIPVDQRRQKVRIARKSSYVEIEAPLWDPLAETSFSLLFPTIQLEKSARGPSDPVSWTATQVNLDILPIIDIKDKGRLQWLTTHASMMFSTQERRIRELNMASHTLSGAIPHLRLEIKDGLFSILMSYTGLQGQQARVFGLSKDVGGINVLFLASSIRLDLINRTVVVDAAAVPLTNVMNHDSRVRSFYQSLTSQGVMQIKVSSDELRSWKSILPALAERCRLWKHTPDCNYASMGEAPIKKGLEDGYSPLCSCGVGKFPTTYLHDLKHSNLQYILKRYATRVAISPIFAVPYVEDCFLAGVSLPKLPLPGPTGEGCGRCGSDKRKNTGTIDMKLLVCSRCRKRSYCSVECQKADWKNHKRACSTQ